MIISLDKMQQREFFQLQYIIITRELIPKEMMMFNWKRVILYCSDQLDVEKPYLLKL